MNTISLDMEKFVDDNGWGTIHTFEIVPDFPYGYIVWNIGRQNFPHEGYIPLCVADENCYVDLSTLKALKVANEEFALTVLKEAGKHHITRRGYFKMEVEAGVITKRCGNCLFGDEPGYCELRRVSTNDIDNCNSHEFK